LSAVVVVSPIAAASVLIARLIAAAAMAVAPVTAIGERRCGKEAQARDCRQRQSECS
jgi:hypothetical protein